MIQDYKESSRKYKDKKRKIGYILIVVVFIFFFILVSAIRVFVKNNNENENIKKLQKQAEKLENENKEIQTLINNYNLDTAKEKIARENLNLKYEGEEVVVINDNKKEVEIKIPLKSIVDASNISNFKKWLLIFFKK